MKKLYTEYRWKQYSFKKQIDELERKRARKTRLKQRRRAEAGLSTEERRSRRSRTKNLQIEAPSFFSLIENPEESIAFLRRILELSANQFKAKKITYGNRRQLKIFIDLSSIEKLTPDAITVLVSIIGRQSKRGIVSFWGNFPGNLEPKSMLLDSGFYQAVVREKKTFTAQNGSIKEKKSHIVESETSKELISFATMQLFGEKVRKQGIGRVFVECMSNTKNHASGKIEGLESWWTSVYCDKKGGKACFTFVDAGIGIFESLKKRGILNDILMALSIRDNRDILKAMLKGEIASRTKLPNRGKGIPGIYEVLVRGQISNLMIISNDVFADIVKEDYKLLDNQFTGTIFYWELIK